MYPEEPEPIPEPPRQRMKEEHGGKEKGAGNERVIFERKPQEQADKENEERIRQESEQRWKERFGQNWFDRPHEELVNALREFILEGVRLRKGYILPEEIVRMKLWWERISPNEEKSGFFFPLLHAWDAVAYDRYEPGTHTDHEAGAGLSFWFHDIRGGAIIKLGNPLQVRLLDALTEAVGIPHQKGLTEIKIPEKLGHYGDWIMSKEYHERKVQWKRTRK